MSENQTTVSAVCASGATVDYQKGSKCMEKMIGLKKRLI